MVANPTREQTFVVEATTAHPDAVTHTPRSPEGTWLHAASARPYNWVPEGASHRLLTCDEPVTEYIEIAVETLHNARMWAETTDDAPVIPDNPLGPGYVTGTAAWLAPRLLSGFFAERTAVKYLHDSGVTFEPLSECEGFSSASAADKAGIDLLAEDGTTYQVKSYDTDPSERQGMTADYLIEVTDDGVTRYRL